ncbi:MAG: HAMP domain-containing protein [Verrucomicrobiota bacterium]|jgi:signal transduction histidine kinase/CheY-like chemotaxis protein|nr:HAMP domain-containing protein [Verrucomicrobiota bacterium]
MKIRAKIIFSIIPLVILPPVIVTLVSFLWTKQIARHTRSFDDSAHRISLSLSHAISNINSIFNDRIQSDYVFIAENTTGTLKLINTFVEREIHQLAVSSVLESYMTVSGSGRDFIAPKVFNQLHSAAVRSGFLSISILNTEGVPLLQYPVNVPLPSLQLPEDKPGWHVYHAHTTEPPQSLLYLAPLRYAGLRVNQDKGTLVGWVVIDMPFSNFTDQLTAVTGTAGLNLILRDTEGNILFQPKSDELLDDPEHTLTIRRNVIPNTLDVEFLIPWREILETTRDTTALLENLDEETLHARNISRQADKFAIKAGIPLSLTLLVVIVIAAFIGRQLAQSFTQPITKLSEAAGKLAAGDLAVNPQLDGNDEVSDLSHSLNHMRLSLREHISNLDRLVAAKTNDLNAKTKALAVSERETRELITRMNDAFAFLEVLPESPAKVLFSNPAYNLLASANTRPERPVPFLDDAQYERCLNVAYTGVADRFDIQTSDDRYFSYNVYSPSPNRLAVVISNLTQKHQAEMEGRRLEEAMRYTQKLESLGVLAGGIAHDFNNLLMAIMGNADLALLEAPPDSALQESLTEIQKSSLRAVSLCKQMLAYSGQGQFVIENYDLSQLIGEMTQLIGVSIPQNVEIQYDFDPDLPLVEGDTTQIRQVVLNLITNASEAMKGAEGHIRITTKAEDLPAVALADNPAGVELLTGRYVTMEVQDDGSGMSPATLSHLFEPFFTTKMTGRGLGMAAVLGIVRAHKGLIRIQSREGQGTTVSISLPAIEATAVKKDPDAALLIAESDLELSAVLDRMLQKSGARTKVFHSGQAAFEAYTEHPEQYSVIFATQKLTLDNNITLVRAILTNDRKAKVIVLSELPEDEAMSPFRDLPVLGYLQKPYQLNRVRALCKRFSISPDAP